MIELDNSPPVHDSAKDTVSPLLVSNFTIFKDKEKSLSPQEIKALIEESLKRATQIHENCLDTAEYISTKS